MVFTGARIGEVLGLQWSDVDFKRQMIRVRRQLTQQGELAEPKTASGKREVVMFPNLAAMLREHRLRSPFSQDGDFVFATRTGTPFSQRNVTGRGLDKAADAIGLNRPGERFRSHDLRHTFASVLIREGADVVFVARQLGHANPAITLRVYAHLFDSEAQSAKMRDALEARFGVTGRVTSGTKGERRGRWPRQTSQPCALTVAVHSERTLAMQKVVGSSPIIRS
jgi:integrase